MTHTLLKKARAGRRAALACLLRRDVLRTENVVSLEAARQRRDWATCIFISRRTAAFASGTGKPSVAA